MHKEQKEKIIKRKECAVKVSEGNIKKIIERDEKLKAIEIIKREV